MNALFMVLLAVAQATAAPDAPTPSDREPLAELQQVLAKAWVAGDRATIERIIAPDWTTTGSDGAVRTRSQVLSEVFDTIRSEPTAVAAWPRRASL